VSSTTPHRHRRLIGVVVLFAVALSQPIGCSNDEDDGLGTATTVQADPEDFLPDPRLPADINPIPYLIGDLVALGNVSLQVKEVRDPDGEAPSTDDRRVTIDLVLTNGALEPVIFDPETIRAYVDTGASATATDPPDALGSAVPSGESREFTLTFDLPASAALLALVFNGTDYGERVKSGLIALDPNFVPAPGDS
jgi:hypothetical protein